MSIVWEDLKEDSNGFVFVHCCSNVMSRTCQIFDLSPSSLNPKMDIPINYNTIITSWTVLKILIVPTTSSGKKNTIQFASQINSTQKLAIGSI